MTLIEKFKEKVLSNDSQFYIVDERKNLYFVKRTVGKATYIFGDYNYNGDFSLDVKMSIKAILSDGNIYIVDTFIFYPLKEEDYPENVFCFDSKVDDINSIIEKELFPNYYSKLPTRELTEDEKNNIINRVRETVLKNNSIVSDPLIVKIMDVENVAKILCGLINLEEYVNEYFENNKEMFITKKSINSELKKLVEVKYNLKDWEIEMASSLRELNAKTVIVDFTVNGESGTEKIEKDALLRILYNKNYFSSYNFVNWESGEALLKKLNVGECGNHEKGPLKCEHINSIKFSKKIIYSKTSI